MGYQGSLDGLFQVVIVAVKRQKQGVGGGASERYNLDYFKCGIKKNISFIMHIPINFKTCLSCPISLHCQGRQVFN